MKVTHLFAYTIVIFSVACGGGQASVITNKENTLSGSVSQVATPESSGKKDAIDFKIDVDKKFKQGDKISVKCTLPTDIDSVQVFLDNRRINISLTNNAFEIPTDQTTKVGTRVVKVIAHKGDLSTTKIGNFVVSPLNEPKQYKARAFKIYKHNRSAYTQGLEFYNGMLYESSGEYGKSYIQSLEFPSLKIKTHKNLNSKMFAEGITFLNDQLYQLTWQENKCFVYDPVTLKQIKEYQYNTEGWGLTNDGKHLYMSDGTKYIYILDPATFQQIDKLEVMVGDKPLTEINEMEWIDGEIWANVFTTDVIVKINPTTGAVTGVIDASGLLLQSDYDNNTNVLNGIAYDHQTKKIYVTGKNWPKLFEIVVQENDK